MPGSNTCNPRTRNMEGPCCEVPIMEPGASLSEITLIPGLNGIKLEHGGCLDTVKVHQYRPHSGFNRTECRRLPPIGERATAQLSSMLPGVVELGCFL
jgi:hypothetical protein